MKIAANDPRLAHALTRHDAVSDGAKRTRLLNLRVERERPSIPNLAKHLRATYGPLLVVEYIRRAKGSRAYAEWIVLMADEDGSVFPLNLVVSRDGVSEYLWPRYRFAAHALARLAQRTLGEASIARSAPILAHHLRTVLSAAPLRTAAQFRTASHDGVFLWQRGPDGVAVARTWLDANSATDETVQADCARSDATHSVVRVT